ncbi:MAG: NAD(P)/FAD-dependent oxidoreductase [Ignavibacteriae bacterium]|nr:NAD(P)/FAD-dependent oxidoreductase [Ignavibacteriota bacterium]
MSSNINPGIAVIGAGPAGASAAVQLARFGYNPVLIEKDEVGGLIRNANCINNYPGFPNGITGLKFAKLLQKHINKYNIKFIKDDVLGVEFENECFYINLKNDTLKFDYLFISSGTKPIKPGSFNKEQLKLFDYDIVKYLRKKNRIFIIIGAGDAAFDYALTLSSSNEVIILNRTKHINAILELQNKVLNNPNIKYYEEIIVTDVTKDKSLLIVHAKQNENQLMKFICNHIIFAIGREPNLEFLGESIKINITELMKNNNLFIIGDAANNQFRQISISTGSAIKSAMQLHSYLLNSKIEK